MEKLFMKITVTIAAIIVSLVACYAGNVEFRECPKCDKRIKIDLKANKAYVNLSKLEGSNKEALAKRAEKLPGLLDIALLVGGDCLLVGIFYGCCICSMKSALVVEKTPFLRVLNIAYGDRHI